MRPVPSNESGMVLFVICFCNLSCTGAGLSVSTCDKLPSNYAMPFKTSPMTRSLACGLLATTVGLTQSPPLGLGSFSYFASFVSDSHGDTFLSLPYEHRLIKVAANGTVEVIAGNGVAALAGDGGPAPLASLNHPTGLALDQAGNLYVSDSGNACVRKIDLAAGTIRVVAGANGLTLGAPAGLALDPAGNLLIADPAGGRVLRLGTYDGALSMLTPADHPYGVAVDPLDGSVVVADLSSERLRRVSQGTLIPLPNQAAAGEWTGDGVLCSRGGVCEDYLGAFVVSDSTSGRALSLTRRPGWVAEAVRSGRAAAADYPWPVKPLAAPTSRDPQTRTDMESVAILDCNTSEFASLCAKLRAAGKKTTRAVFTVQTPTPSTGVRGASTRETRDVTVESVDFRTLNGHGTVDLISRLPKSVGDLPQGVAAVFTLEYALDPTVLRYSVRIRGSWRHCVNSDCGPATPFNAVINVSP